MKFTLECTREDDGRWLAEVPQLGVRAYGDSEADALTKAQALALRVLAGRLKAASSAPSDISMQIIRMRKGEGADPEPDAPADHAAYDA